MRKRYCRPVTGHECEGNFPIGQDVGHGIGFLPAQVHVEDAGLQIIAFGGKHGVAEAAVGAVDLVSESGQHVRQHHRYQRLVFHKKDALVIRIRRNELCLLAIDLPP